MPKGRRARRVFLDANVLFSAADGPEGRCAALFELAARGKCVLLTSAYAVTEADRNLRHKKPEALKAFAALLEKIRIVGEPNPAKRGEAEGLGLDPGDVPILAAAFERCDLLVTGDRKHFGIFMGRSVRGIRVMSPGEALAALL